MSLHQALEELVAELDRREDRWHEARDNGELTHDEAVSATLEDRWVIGRIREIQADAHRVVLSDATVERVSQATGWAEHVVRTVLAAAVKEES